MPLVFYSLELYKNRSKLTVEFGLQQTETDDTTHIPGESMANTNYRDLPLHEKLALDCENSLVKAAESNASGGEWLPTDREGKEFLASMHVDEQRDCPVIELRDAESNTVEHRFRVKVSCIPISKRIQTDQRK